MTEFLKAGALPARLGREIVEDLARYSVGFLNVSSVGAPQLLGSGTLIQAGDTRAIMTAHHVIDVLPTSGRLGLLLSRSEQAHTVDTNGLTLLKIARGKEDATGPDLGAVILSASIAGAIGAKKSFYSLDRDRLKMTSRPIDLHAGLWFVNGFVDEWTMEGVGDDENVRVKRFYHLSGVGGPDEAPTKQGLYDYLICSVTYDERPHVPNLFGGMSGGAVWQVPIRKNPDGSLSHERPLLAGVVFYQLPTTEVQCGVKCHGPDSVYRAVYDAIWPE